MNDKLKLLDDSVPLQNRYDLFLLWDHENNCSVTYLIAEKLGISVGVVEIYFELATLDPEEFEIIDKKRITMDSLFLIVKQNKALRLKVYENYESIVVDSIQPMRAIKKFIDDDCEPDFKERLHKISAKAYSSIASYLKAVDIANGTITKSFRPFLISISKRINNEEDLSDKQADWLIRAIAHDKNMSLNVFTNDGLKKDYPDDFVIFQEIIASIDDLVIKS